MEQNVGTVDRIIRFVIGIIALGLVKYSYWWLILAIPALFTASTGFCWPYKLFKINTTKTAVIEEKVKVRSKKKL